MDETLLEQVSEMRYILGNATAAVRCGHETGQWGRTKAYTGARHSCEVLSFTAKAKANV